MIFTRSSEFPGGSRVQTITPTFFFLALFARQSRHHIVKWPPAPSASTDLPRPTATQHTPLAAAVGGHSHHGRVTHILSRGARWGLHGTDRQIARLTVTSADMPWVYADVEPLPGFEQFRALFEAQEQAIDQQDDAQADLLYTRIRAALSMTFPDGRVVPEFLLHIHADGTASFRWHDEPFEREDR